MAAGTREVEDAGGGNAGGGLPRHEPHHRPGQTRNGRRRFEVKIPPGVDTGAIVTIRPSRGRELQVETAVLPDSRFKRSGADLYTDVKVSMFDALLGGETEVDTIAGRVSLKIPAGSQNGQRVRLSGRGMPALRDPDKKGDLFRKRSGRNCRRS